jgi:hypothetical protein
VGVCVWKVRPEESNGFEQQEEGQNETSYTIDANRRYEASRHDIIDS